MPSRQERLLRAVSKKDTSFVRNAPSLKEGEDVFALFGGNPLRYYVKLGGIDWYMEFTEDGNKHVKKSLDVGHNLSVGRMFTAPGQTAFLAYNSSSDTNIAKDEWVTIDFNTEVFDRTHNFASDTFTAPKNGLYLLSTNVVLQTLDVDATRYRARINTSNRVYISQIDPNYSADLSYYTFSITAVADMDKADTASVEVYQTGGLEQTDVTGAVTLNTYFCGWFLG